MCFGPARLSGGDCAGCARIAAAYTHLSCHVTDIYMHIAAPSVRICVHKPLRYLLARSARAFLYPCANAKHMRIDIHMRLHMRLSTNMHREMRMHMCADACIQTCDQAPKARATSLASLNGSNLSSPMFGMLSVFPLVSQIDCSTASLALDFSFGSSSESLVANLALR